MPIVCFGFEEHPRLIEQKLIQIYKMTSFSELTPITDMLNGTKHTNKTA